MYTKISDIDFEGVRDQRNEPRLERRSEDFWSTATAQIITAWLIFLDACTSQVPGGLCKKLSNGECWCRDAKIEDCKCTLASGCPGGGDHYGSHAGYELCGYQPGYEGTYFPATQAAATAFGYTLSSSSSCAKNTLRWDSRIIPLDCPKHQPHCRNGFCNWLTQKDAWNKKSCGVQACCTAFVRY